MKYILTSLIFSLIVFCSNAQVSIGRVAPEISLPDANGNIIQLSSLKGKVVLIDFWASWCGPCRYSNPGVVRLYKKFKDKGFEVFGVSVDSKKSAWLRAVKKDRISYTQVNDNAGWSSATIERYDVSMIPTTFLLNKSGEVVAIDLEGRELEKAIESLIN